MFTMIDQRYEELDIPVHSFLGYIGWDLRCFFETRAANGLVNKGFRDKAAHPFPP